MLSEIWNTILVHPILNLLAAFYKLSESAGVENLGIAIILLTLLVRFILIPATLPSLKTTKKQRDLKPEMDKIREKYKNDKRKQAEMQMELFKKHGINPASGCLTQIVMIIVLIALYGVIRRFTQATDIADLNNSIYFDFLKFASVDDIQKHFLWIKLDEVSFANNFVLAFLSGVLQLFQSKMSLPYVEAGEKAAKKTPDKTDDIAYNMQEQMLYTMPVMNFVIGITLPAGVVLYILTTTVFSVVQTYFVSGWGGLKSWLHKLGIKVK